MYFLSDEVRNRHTSFFFFFSVKRHQQNITTIEQHRITIYFKLLNDERHELLLKTTVMITVNVSVNYTQHFQLF